MSYKFIVLLAGLAFTATGLADAATAPQWVEGKNYQVISPALPTHSSDKVEVTEVFSYACPHCAHFQPFADKLQASLPDGVVYVYKPAVFSKAWEPFARAYLTASILGVVDKTHQALFDAIHRDRKPIRTLHDLGQFYAAYGVDAGTFVSTAESFVVTSKMQRDVEWERKAGVRGTPTIIVNGKYRLGPRSAGGFEQMVELTQWLVQKELAAPQPEK